MVYTNVVDVTGPFQTVSTSISTDQKPSKENVPEDTTFPVKTAEARSRASESVGA